MEVALEGRRRCLYAVHALAMADTKLNHHPHLHILLRKCWIQFYYTIVSNLALFASAFRCLLRTAISWFKCFKFSINCNCSYKNWHKKIEPHNVWWCFKSCRKVLNIIKISYVGKEIQCTPNKSQKISTGLMSTILSMSQNTSEKTKSPYYVFGKWKWIVKAKSVSLFRNTPILTCKLI